MPACWCGKTKIHGQHFADFFMIIIWITQEAILDINMVQCLFTFNLT